MNDPFLTEAEREQDRERERVERDDRLERERVALTEAADYVRDAKGAIADHEFIPRHVRRVALVGLEGIAHSLEVRAESARRRMTDPPGSRKVR